MINELITLSKEAGKAILSYYDEPIKVYKKAENSPLTLADLAAHNLILDGLKQLKNIPIISEEGDIPDYQDRKEWTQYWLIDPLDGTKEFINGNGEFTVNIALIKEGIPTIGVVSLPAKDITYTGEKDQGSFLIDDKGLKTRIHSTQPDLSSPLTVVVSRSHASNTLDEKLAERGIRVGKKIKAGSSLKFCRVAEGSVDIYPRFGPTMEWDTAAGDAVYRYSGIQSERNSTLLYNKPSLKHLEFIIGL
ncbi:MAG: 3'(2'),5'-bisphosphate nucleotidase CysQ [Balneolales bacterium]